ncbi:MAG: hypothetical protein N2652_00585 [Kiritimatiellae bacterium]|nr:hypothetical protein [Kiritimatiellia bacterium]
MRRIVATALLAVGPVAASAGWYPDHDTVRVSRAEADLREAGLFRLPDGTLVMRIRCGSAPPSRSLRLLIETPATGAAGRVESWMIENDVLYRRAFGLRGWAWDEAGGVISVESAYGVRSVLLPPAWGPPLKWAVETLTPDWNVADRLPAEGLIASSADRIPELAIEPPPAPEPPPRVGTPPALAARWTELAGGEGWTNDESALPLPAWKLAGGETVSFALTVREAGGAAWPTEVEASARRGDRQQWRGRSGPVSWTLLAMPEGEGWTWLGGELRADTSVAVELELGLGLPPAQWRLQQPDGRSLPIGTEALETPDLVAAGPGRRGLRSLWPLVVASCPTAAVVIALDPAEPAPVLWTARESPPALRGAIPLALSAAVTKLRNRAVWALWVRCGASPLDFRAALSAWQRRAGVYRDTYAAPAQWRLSPEESTSARATLSGPIAVEVLRGDEPGAGSEWRCLGLRPWALDLPLPKGWSPDIATALRILQFLAAAGGSAAWYAQAAIVGGVRSTDDTLSIAAVNGRLLRVNVSADPDFMTTAAARWNRAMLELGAVRHVTEAAPVHVIALDALSATAGLDHNAAALASADRPASWRAPERGVAVVRDLDALEFVEALRKLVGTEAPLIALENPFDHHATLVRFADLTVVDDALDADPLSSRSWRHRLLAGPRPVVRRLSGDFEWSDPRTMDGAAAVSTALGMVPSFGRDAQGRSYWSVAQWSRRDAVALRYWVPLAVRLAEGGWRVEPCVAVDEGGVRAEAFGGASGVLHVTVWNRGSAVRDVRLVARGISDPAYVFDLRDATVRGLAAPDGLARWSARLGPGEVRVFDVVSGPAVGAERGWLEAWGDAQGVGAAAAANLQAMELERRRGVELEVEPSLPFVRGTVNRVRARVRNASSAPLVIADVRRIAGSDSAPMLREPRILAAGETADFGFGVDEAVAPDGSWLLWQWRMQQPEAEWTTVRRTPSRWTAPVEIGALVFRAVAPGVVEVRLPLRNHTEQQQELTVEWAVPSAPPQRTVTVLEPLEAREMTLPVTGEPGSSARVEVRVRGGGRELYRGDVRAVWDGKSATPMQ